MIRTTTRPPTARCTLPMYMGFLMSEPTSSLAEEAVRLFLTEHPYPKKKDIKSLQIEIEEMNDDENF